MNGFPVLSFVSQLLKVLGWIVVVVGLIGAISGLAMGQSFFGGRLASALPGLSAAVTGLVVVAVGESIGVLFAIEANTRAAAERTKELAAAIRQSRTSG